MHPESSPSDVDRPAGHAPAQRPPAPCTSAHEPAAATEPALSDRELKILAFEAKWWRHAGSKEQAIRDTFELSSTRYYQLLNALLDNPAALEHEPVLVGRLRRLRATRTRTRRR
ncbi:DUF3263 domain-containing protein [Actinoplanes sp. NPDC049265]|uniref:DUF3263 domain-containing protein n=1 Tax=Actinoplanes sp. NPDC049265 TaxID=3363902 RepID=UPI003715DC3C